MMPGHILIVDDHEVVRRGIRSLLSACPEWEICGEAADGLEAVEKAKVLRPDIVLMDVSMPRMDGVEATRILRRDLPKSKVVIVSQNDPAIGRRQAREADAAGYVAKSDLWQALLPTIARLLGSGDDASAVDHQPAAPASSAQEWLAGGGELSRLIQEHDWSQTPLGPLDGWPQSLKTSVSICLASRFPIVLYWGPERVVLYNDAYRAILGTKHPWALGQRCCDCWAEIWDTIGPMLDSVVQTGEATWSNDLLLVLHRYGYAEECYFSFSFSPVRVEAGAVGGIFTAVIETTENIIGERRLRTLRDLAARAVDAKSEEDAYRIAAETLSENSYDVPFSALCARTNGRFQVLSSSGIPSGHPLRSLLCGAGPQFSQKMDEVIRSEQLLEISLATVGCEFPLGAWDAPPSEALLMPIPAARENGSPGVLVCAVSPKKKLDEKYRTFFSLVTRQIVTSIADARSHYEERKRAEALAEIDRAKTAFFSNVSHEFRTPLTLMLGPVEELLSRSHTDLSPAAKNQLELVNRNGSRLLRLVNTLLDFSRIEAGRMQAIYQPTDLPAFTVELASVFRSATDKAGLWLEVDCAKLDEPVFVDRGMWEKIVLNLISNAFKFTFEGKIVVALAREGNDVALRVRDTGVGIAAQELPRLFERFHRIENTRSRTHEGSGIGLALVQELVKLHGGAVRVESAEGEGSTFIVSLPLGSGHLPSDRIGGTRSLASTAVGAAPFVEEALRWLPEAGQSDVADELLPGDELIPIPCPPLANTKVASEKRPLILVADDNADMRQYLVRLLAERYDVEAVPDGEAALASARERTPNLVLTDVMMPNLDGFGLLHELRSDPQTRTLPIIVLSARAGEESRVEGMEHGADDYLIKPFSARELLARVQTHLEMSQVRKQAEQDLRRRSEQFATLLNEAPLGVYLVDSDFRIREVNPTALPVFGSVANLIGRDFDEVIHILWPKGHADEIVRRFRQTLKTGEPYVVPEWTEKRLDRGAIEYYEWRITRIPLPEGQFGVVCYFRDISRQVLAREAIAASEQRLRLATEAAELGIWHWYPEEDRVTWENERPYEVFARTHEQGPISAAEFRAKFCHPDDLRAFEEAFSRTLETGNRFFFQGRIYRTDRTCVWVEFTGQVEHGSDGLPLRLLGTVQDITSRKQAEEMLRQHRERFDLVAEAAQVGFWFCDLPFDRLIWDNMVKDHFWLPPDAEVTIDTFYDRLHPDDRERTRQAIAESNASDIPYDIEYRTLSPDGRQKWIRAMGRTFYDSARQPKRFDGITLDITERMRAEENYRTLAQTLDAEVRVRTSEVVQQAEQLRDLSSRLLQAQDEERRHIARELHDSAGQILTALSMSLAQAARHAPQEPAGFTEYVKESEQLVQQLSQEIRTMSYLLHPPLLDETGLAEALRWYIQGLAERSGLEIALEVPADFERLSREMELVMFRLVQECLTNIHRHSGSKTAVILIARDRESVALEVQDEGKGIAAEKLVDLQSQGSGVGIRGMRERVRHFGGQMDIESNRGGTKISFKFPLPQDATAKREQIVGQESVV
jgi:PAS domain S-box-containing protein